MKLSVSVLSPKDDAILRNILLILTAINAFLSYSGVELIMQEIQNDLDSRIVAGVYAGGSWAVLYLVWHFIAKTLPFVQTHHMLPVSVVVIFTCVFSFGLSGNPNAAAMYGLNALKIEMNETVTIVAEEIHERDQSILRVEGLRHDITDQSRLFRQMAEDDRKFGKYTGFASSGAFTLAADQIADSLENLDKEIGETLSANAEKITSANNITEAMRETILRVEVPFQTRIASLDTDIQSINKILNSVSVANLSGIIERSLKRHTHMVDGMRPTSKRADVAAGQKIAISALQSQVHITSDTMQSVLQELSDLDKTEPIKAKPDHIMKATIKHWQQFAPQFIGAIAFDLSPFIVVILLFIRVRMMQERNGQDGPTEPTVTLGEAVKIIHQLRELESAQNQSSKEENPKIISPSKKASKQDSDSYEYKPWLKGGPNDE